MKLEPIINSLLENDLYKFNMGNVIFKHFNHYTCTWTFKCRNENVKFTNEMLQEIREQIDYYCDTCSFTISDISYLKKTCPWLSDGYLNFLKFWRPDRNEIFVQSTNQVNLFGNDIVAYAYNDCGLAIEAKGTWLSTSMYEIPILAIVNEVYFAFKYGINALDNEFYTRLHDKVTDLKNYPIGAFSEFGMRRRLSSNTQDKLIETLKSDAPGFVGTSNVYLASKYNVKPVGTQAHEYYMALQSKFELNPTYTNWFGMKTWVDEYQTLNGIALTDTLGTDLFLRDFNLTYATLFSGVRHDSGDPIEWGEKMLEHYRKLNIDPHTKTLLFSDALDFKKAFKIYAHFRHQCKVAFGIGTYLANDTNVEPLNIVMKMTECNGCPVAKISNTPSKGMCKSKEYEDYLLKAIQWRLAH